MAGETERNKHMNEPCKWKVSFEDLRLKRGHYPFYRQTSVVTAASRREAVEIVQARFSPPAYGHFKASKCREQH